MTKHQRKELIEYLKERKADPTLIKVYESLERKRGIRLRVRPKVTASSITRRGPTVRKVQFTFGKVVLTSGMVNTVSSALGECPRDHRGILSPHWERKGRDEFCQVLICSFNPSHRFKTHLCITSEQEAEGL